MGRVECTDAGVTLAEQGPQVEDQLLRHRPRLKKPPSGGSNFGAASASPPSRFERLTSLKPPALPGDIYLASFAMKTNVCGVCRTTNIPMQASLTSRNLWSEMKTRQNPAVRRSPTHFIL